MAELIAEEGPLGPSTEELADEISALDDRLRVVAGQTQQLLSQRILSPDDGLKILRDLSRAAVAPAVVSQLVDEATGSIEATAAEARATLDGLA